MDFGKDREKVRAISSSRHLVGRGRGGTEGVRIRDHLANVRTFLAWLRSGLMLLAMGYAVAKFQVIESPANRYLGVLIAVAGWLIVALAGTGYARQRRAIEAADFAPSVSWNLGLSLLAASAGAIVLVYLVRT
jgi:putative membrane protein